MRTRELLIVLTVLMAPAAALAQPSTDQSPPAGGPAAGEPAPAAGELKPVAEPAAGEPAPAAGEPAPAAGELKPVAEPSFPPPPGEPVPCRLAGAPEAPPPGQQPATYHSPMRQTCEDELSRDHDWWFNLEERLRKQVHRQAFKEVKTNNRHVFMAYAAFWLLTVAFVLVMWRRQQGLKDEIVRLERELARVLADDDGPSGGGKPGGGAKGGDGDAA